MSRRSVKYQYVTKANIILFGTGNSGKTTTLKILYYLLVGSMPPINTPRVQITYRGKKIDFAFNGDHIDVVEDNLAFFADNPCDIAVSPTRTEGGPVMAMNYFIDKSFPITENILWKRTTDIPSSKRAAKKYASEPSSFAKNLPQSYQMANKLKEIIDEFAV